MRRWLLAQVEQHNRTNSERDSGDNSLVALVDKSVGAIGKRDGIGARFLPEIQQVPVQVARQPVADALVRALPIATRMHQLVHSGDSEFLVHRGAQGICELPRCGDRREESGGLDIAGVHDACQPQNLGTGNIQGIPHQQQPPTRTHHTVCFAAGSRYIKPVPGLGVAQTINCMVCQPGCLGARLPRRQACVVCEKPAHSRGWIESVDLMSEPNESPAQLTSSCAAVDDGAGGSIGRG